MLCVIALSSRRCGLLLLEPPVYPRPRPPRLPFASYLTFSRHMWSGGFDGPERGATVALTAWLDVQNHSHLCCNHRDRPLPNLRCSTSEDSVDWSASRGTTRAMKSHIRARPDDTAAERRRTDARRQCGVLVTLARAYEDSRVARLAAAKEASCRRSLHRQRVGGWLPAAGVGCDAGLRRPWREPL